MVEYDDLEEFVGETVIVTTMKDAEYIGELESYEDDFALTLTGNGPDPDNMTAGEWAQYAFVDGSRIFNGENVESVRADNREYRDEGEDAEESNADE